MPVIQYINFLADPADMLRIIVQQAQGVALITKV